MTEHDPQSGADTPPTLIDRWLLGYTRWASRNAWSVLGLAVVLLAVCWGLASQLKVKGDFLNLLPTESGAAKRFTRALERKGGSASTLIAIVESPDESVNRRLVDALAGKLRALPLSSLTSVQTGSAAERKFFTDQRWLFASERDLRLIACELERERERQAIGDLDDESCETYVEDELKRLGIETKPSALLDAPSPANASAAPAAPSGTSPLSRIRARLDSEVAQYDRFDSGYFKNKSGTRYAVVVRAKGAGMGELGSEELLERAKETAAQLAPERLHPQARIGFAGDIPNAVAERRSLLADIALVSSLATVLILSVILAYFRSPLVLLHIGLATAVGCGVAFAVAKLALGHLNMATGFLGSIIAGNGINIPMIYLSRYRELQSSGMAPAAALEQTALDVRRGTWLGALAAAGAYGALSVTSFRGFSEFGLIGGTGSLACWFAAFGLCPASLSALERWRGPARRERVAEFDPAVMRGVAKFVVRRAGLILVAVAALAAVSTRPTLRYLEDPWEYDFGKLRSASSSKRGAGHFSVMADEIFQRRGSPDLLLADDMPQALAVAKAVVARDQKYFGGKLVERVTTVHDYLGGAPDSVARKLEVLDSIRREIDRALPRLRGADLEFAKEWRPPERLRALTGEDLPPLLRERFTESDGRFGTAVFVELDRKLSRSKGESLLRIADLLEGVTTPQGEVVPNASRATVFAEMIRSMKRDAPLSVFVALTIVIVICGIATGTLQAFVAVMVSLILAVWLTLGVASLLDVRLNFLNFVALPLTFGIGVEYAINLVDRVRALRGDVAAAIGSVGGAVAACSMTTLLGYGTLLVGDNLALRSFGKYAMFGELSCLIMALTVMPAGLVLWRRLGR